MIDDPACQSVIVVVVRRAPVRLPALLAPLHLALRGAPQSAEPPTQLEVERQAAGRRLAGISALRRAQALQVHCKKE
jgi:hypothetical protein